MIRKEHFYEKEIIIIFLCQNHRGKDTTEITDGTLVLTDSKGNIIQQWDNLSASGLMLVTTKTASGVTKGETYTLSITVTVKTHSNSETITESIVKTY